MIAPGGRSLENGERRGDIDALAVNGAVETGFECDERDTPMLFSLYPCRKIDLNSCEVDFCQSCF